MVVKVDSVSYTVAEVNFSLGGGGRYILDFRRIPWPGRGLAVVEELCGKWDWHMPKDGRGGRWVRAAIEPS
jgi:hypothetical protein